MGLLAGQKIREGDFAQNSAGASSENKVPKAGNRGFVSGGWIEAAFGDGSDGDVTISSPTTLTRNMYYNNLTVNDVLTTDGYRIFVKNTLAGNGTIKFPDGDRGTNAGAGNGTTGGGSGGQGGNANNQARPLVNTPGAGGGGGGAGTLLGAGNQGNGSGGSGGAGGNGGGKGGDGGTGNNTTGGGLGQGGVVDARLGSTPAGVQANNGANGATGPTDGGNPGRAGGNGGNGLNGQIGANGTGSGNNTAMQAFGLSRMDAYNLMDPTPYGFFARRIPGANGGKGGSGGGANTGGSSAGRRSGAGGGGGGAGASGGPVWIAARVWNGTFTIMAKGGNGGNGSDGAPPNSVGAGNATGGTGGDGGNGGPGGISVVIYQTKSWTGTYTLTGGVGGVKGAGGAANGASAGTDGSNGANGANGTSYEFNIANLGI